MPHPDVAASPGRVVQLELFGDGQISTDSEPRRKPWDWLLRHVFGEDLQSCPHCAGPMRWLEAATAPDGSRARVREGGHGLVEVHALDAACGPNGQTLAMK